MELILTQTEELKTKKAFRPRYDTRIIGMADEGDNGYFDYGEALKRLDFYYKKVKCQILAYQSSTLGLFPTDLSTSQEGHIRDSVYCSVAVWSLFLAYRRIDDDKGRTYELGQSTVKCMRGILRCWINQSDKLEKFKNNQTPKNALHSRFHLITGDTVCSEEQYGHLQIDVVSLYIIYLVEMISSGLQIIYSMDEVNFIQNLVYYVERAYRIPDYGLWERGSKYHNGSCELHASSIGMAKAALEAINGFNLFGDQGASWSVIYVDIDAHNRNRTIFESLIPRESSSKNVDASLIPTISFPCFVTHREVLKKTTMNKVLRKLKGRYGFKRFLRDGYKTALEDSSRKYYHAGEVKLFDGIECEWPIFFIYLIIDGIFKNDQDQVDEYQELLNKVLIYKNEDAFVPKYYYVPLESIELEKAKPGSQTWLPSGNKPNEIFLWGQSLYLISQLLVERLLHINELDPIRRYLPAAERPRQSLRYSSFQGTCIDLGVQVVLIAESMRLQAMLATYGIQTQTPHQIEPIQIWSPNELIKVFEHLGVNKKLGLSGRPLRPIGTLGTSKVYRIMGATVICYPLLFEVKDFYLSYDMAMLIDDIRSDITFVAKCWKLRGRPTYCMLIREENMKGDHLSEILKLLATFKRGSCDGIPIKIGRLQNLTSTSCIEHLDFYHMVTENEDIFHPFQELTFKTPSSRSLTDIPTATKIVEEEFVELMPEIQSKPTREIILCYNNTSSLCEQCQLLHILLKREGLHFLVNDVSVQRRLEKLICQAGNVKNWTVVRFCSSLLGKLVDSLAPSITSVLVTGKQLTVGVFGFEEVVIDKPVTPNEIKNIIYKTCGPHDMYHSVLQQELIISIGKIIATSPHIFEGILKLRIGWIIHAMMLELEYENRNEKSLNSMAPSDINLLLLRVLTFNTGSANRTPLQRRCLDGALNRVPRNFYDSIWEIMVRTPGGLTVAGKNLPQQPTLSDMTMYEINFSLTVENLLNKIGCPEYRQLTVELFVVVATILERNPELSFQGTVNTDQLVNEAFDMFKYDNQKKQKTSDMSIFYNTSPSIENGTTCYLAKAVLHQLLHSSNLLNNSKPCNVS